MESIELVPVYRTSTPERVGSILKTFEMKLSVNLNQPHSGMAFICLCQRLFGYQLKTKATTGVDYWKPWFIFLPQIMYCIKYFRSQATRSTKVVTHDRYN